MNKTIDFIVGNWYRVKINNQVYEGFCHKVEKKCLFLKVLEFDAYFDKLEYVIHEISLDVICGVKCLGNTKEYIEGYYRQRF